MAGTIGSALTAGSGKLFPAWAQDSLSLQDLLESNAGLACAGYRAADVRRFYELRNFSPVWAPDDAEAAIAMLREADLDALSPAAYMMDPIKRIGVRSSLPSGPAFEFALTDAMLTYIGDMCGARSVAFQGSLPYELPPSLLDPISTLSNAIDNGELSRLPRDLAPQHLEYFQLKAAKHAKKLEAPEKPGQVTANMERWRWLPSPFESSYIVVNSADCTLKFVRDGEVVLASRIITGRPESPTPLFKTLVTGVTVNPSWDIPGDIAEKEILPKAKKSAGFFNARHIVADRPGGALRQLPGADNALGQIMLEMPNRFDCYLHDTPMKKLFARPDRHFSHGCIRVENMEALASCILGGDPTAGLDELHEAIASGDTLTLALPQPLPVYALYWTAVPSDDGSVGFRRDVYGWDARMLAALREGRNGKPGCLQNVADGDRDQTD
jgi:murein L,D-transpeptidase YcbB/YkuD